MFVFEHRIALYPENFGKLCRRIVETCRGVATLWALECLSTTNIVIQTNNILNEMLSNYVIVSAQVDVLNKFAFVFVHSVSFY